MTDFIASLQTIFSPNVVTYVIMPALIFTARFMDVTLGTFRIIFTARGKRYIAPIFGFVEVFIWVTAMGQIIKNVNNVTAYLSYAAGFAAGTFFGLYLEEKLAIGTLVIRSILTKDCQELIEQLHDAGYGVTRVDAHGVSGKVNLIYTIVKRRDVPEVTNIIHKYHPKAFLSIEEVRSTQEGIFPVHRRTAAWAGNFSLRKSK
jgi:uncharacterized protein YebE (UPF0316 family)